MQSKGKLLIAIILTLALMLAVAPVSADALNYDQMPGEEVKVLLEGYTGASSYTVTIGSGSFDIVNYATGATLSTVSSGTVTFTVSGSYPNFTYRYDTGSKSGSASSPLMVVPQTSDDYFTFDGKSYRGCFKVIHGSTTFCAVNEIDVELYLYGVVGRELGYTYNMEATKAQAVASRSYAVANYESNNTYYDLRADTYSQVYGGKDAESSSIRQAVDATEGWVLKYNGNTVQTYFSSNMGGYSENIENVWVSNAVPIVGVPSPYDKYAENYGGRYGASTYHNNWDYTPEKLADLANDYGNTDIGTYESISFSTTYNGQTSVSNRQMKVTINGSNGSVTATKDDIRSLLGLWSTKIRINGETNGTSVGDSITIDRWGYGHGVGLSQFGAIAMGDPSRGDYTWDEIIEHYYCANTDISLVGTVWTNPFSDVNSSNWFYDAVKYVNSHNLMLGTSPTKFAPDVATTRGMIVTILWRIEGEPSANNSTFTDLTQDWYRTAVNWAAENGIVDGYSSTRYGPNDNITREQLMKILYNYADHKGYDISATTSLSSFPDAYTINSWALQATKWAVAEGYVNGSDGKIDPQGNATRAQIATVLYRFLEDMQ